MIPHTCKNLNNTIQELGRCVQSAHQEALMQFNRNGISSQDLFEVTLNHELQNFTHHLPASHLLYTMNETRMLKQGMNTILEMEKSHTVNGVNRAPWVVWGSK